MNTQHYFTVPEVAKTLRISKSTVYTLVHQRKIGHIKLGGRVVFKEEHVRKYAESNVVDVINYD